MNRHFEDTQQGAMRAIAPRRPNVFSAFLALAHEVMHTDSSLSKLEREILGAYVSRQFGCDYCHYGHLDTAEALGGADARQVLDNPDERMALLFQLADKIIANEPTDAQIDAMLDLGFDEKAVEDVIFVTSLFGFANRMVTGFKIEYIADRDRAGSQQLANG